MTEHTNWNKPVFFVLEYYKTNRGNLLVQMFWTFICQVIFVITFVLSKLRFSFKYICNLASELKIKRRPTEVTERILKVYWNENMTEGRRLKKCSKEIYSKAESWRNLNRWRILKQQIKYKWFNKVFIFKRDIKILYYIKYINIIFKYGRNIPDNWYTQWNRIFGCPIQTSYASVLIHSSIIPYLLYMQIYVNVNIHNLYIYIEYICL